MAAPTTTTTAAASVSAAARRRAMAVAGHVAPASASAAAPATESGNSAPVASTTAATTTTTPTVVTAAAAVEKVAGLAAASASGLGLDGHVVIVTGSGQGIGRETALLFARNGANVVVTDIDAGKSDAVAAEINAAGGGKAISFPGDVTDKAFPEAIMDATIKAFGKLNCLVNNAGFTWDAIIAKTTDEMFDKMLAVHNTAPFRLIRAATPHFRDAFKAEVAAGKEPEPRNIINISSTSGLHGNFGQINYATAKAGVEGMTKTVAKEWGQYNVRCNAVAFGFITTRLTAAKTEDNHVIVDGKKVALGIPAGPSKEALMTVPLRRVGAPNEAAASIVLLASPLSSFITGHTLECTGGAGI